MTTNVLSVGWSGSGTGIRVRMRIQTDQICRLGAPAQFIAWAFGGPRNYEELSAINPGWAVWLADNPDTPGDILASLKDDSSIEVRSWLARNSSAPPEVLSQLAQDHSSLVRSAVAANCSTPPAVLQGMVHDPDEEVLYALAENPFMPPEALRLLAASPDWTVRWWVVNNPQCTRDILAELRNDAKGSIRRAVEARLRDTCSPEERQVSTSCQPEDVV